MEVHFVTPELIQFTKLSDTNPGEKKKGLFPVQFTKQVSLTTALTRVKTEGSKPTSLQAGNTGTSEGKRECRGGGEGEGAVQLPPLTETTPALLLLELVPDFY